MGGLFSCYHKWFITVEIVGGSLANFFWQWDTPTLLRNGRVNGQINAFRSIKNMQHSRPPSQEAPICHAVFSLLLLFHVWSSTFEWGLWRFSWVQCSFRVKNGMEDRILGAICKRGFDRLASSICRKKGSHALFVFYYWHVSNGK